MKKTLSTLVAALLCLAIFAACGTKPDIPTTAQPTSTTAQPTSTIASPDPTPTGPAPASTAEPPSRTRDDVTMRREIKKDGLVLEAGTGYQHQFTGEPFTLTASITNTTGHDITYGVGSGTPDMHREIEVVIGPKSGYGSFIDMDTWGKLMTADYKFATLKAGETFTETIRLIPGTTFANYREDVDVLSSPEFSWFPAGEYQGTAVFTYYTGTGENPGKAKKLQLEFPVILI